MTLGIVCFILGTVIGIPGVLADDRPWWCREPKSDVFIRDRIRDRSHRDYLEGHHDAARQTGYFTYFDH